MAKEEKYSAKDLCEVFNVKQGSEIKNALKNIESSKAVQYFMNKKKSDTGVFLLTFINLLNEYINVENICKHGATNLDEAKNLSTIFENFYEKYCKFFICYFEKNKLPDGKTISLVSSLRNNKLKTAIANFVEATGAEIYENLDKKLKTEFYMNVLANEVEKICNSKMVDEYKGTDTNDFQQIRIGLTHVFLPIKGLETPLDGLSNRISNVKWDSDCKHDTLMTAAGRHSTNQAKRFHAIDAAALAQFIIELIKKYVKDAYDRWTCHYPYMDREYVTFICDILSGKQKVPSGDYKNELYKTFLTDKGICSFEGDVLADENAKALCDMLILEPIKKHVFGGDFAAKAFIESGVIETINKKLKEIFDKRFPPFLDAIAEYKTKDDEAKQKALKKAQEEQEKKAKEKQSKKKTHNKPQAKSKRSKRKR